MQIDDFLSLAEARTSCRSYKNKKVPEQMIEKCLAAARLAPSACNKQPWRFVLVENQEKRTRLCEKAIPLGLPMPWMKSAPLIVALCAEKSVIPHMVGTAVTRIKYYKIDIGIAGEHFILAAQAQGLGTCWVGWIKPKKVRNILGLPRSWEVVSLITVGFPDTESTMREKLDIAAISRKIL